MKLSVKSTFAAIIFTSLLTACAGKKEPAVNIEDLQNPVWQLVQLDGKDFIPSAKSKAPSIKLDARMTATGFSGCNDYLGEAILDAKKHRFRLTHLISSQKLCLKEQVALEQTMIGTLLQENYINIEKAQMTIQNKTHTLIFKALPQ